MTPLAQYLKKLREQADLSQVRLSIKSGLHDTTLGKIESGFRRPTGKTLERILNALDCTEAERRNAAHLLAMASFPLGLVQSLEVGLPPQRGTRVSPGAPSPKRRRVGKKLAAWLLGAAASGGTLLNPLPAAAAWPITSGPQPCMETADMRDSVAWRRKLAA